MVFEVEIITAINSSASECKLSASERVNSPLQCNTVKY